MVKCFSCLTHCFLAHVTDTHEKFFLLPYQCLNAWLGNEDLSLHDGEKSDFFSCLFVKIENIEGFEKQLKEHFQ